MINPTEYRLSCDERAGCAAEKFDSNQFRLRDEAESEGWTFYVKLDGEQAQRGGKDYCPKHRRGGESR